MTGHRFTIALGVFLFLILATGGDAVSATGLNAGRLRRSIASATTEETSTAAIAGQDWLFSAQNADGSFGVAPLTPRDSAVAVLALAPRSDDPGLADGLAYLAGLPAISTQFDSLEVQALARNGEPFTEDLEGLSTYRNGDGMGAFGTYDSNLLDTAFSVQALAEDESTHLLELVELLDYLQASQNDDGGWGFVPESTSEIYYTAEILLALGRLQELSIDDAVLSAAQSFLASHQAADGSFGDPAETALVFRSLVATGADLSTLTASPVDALLAAQETDGSWAGDVFTTGQAVLALEVDAPNLVVSDLTAPSTVAAGDPVIVSATVRNVGTAIAPSSRLALLADSATSGDERATADVPELAPGATFTADLEVATTGDEGELVLVAVADADTGVSEAREDDNTASVRIALTTHPDPAVFGSDLDVSPDQPRPGEAFDLLVSIRNLGEQEIDSVPYRIVELVAGAPTGILVEASAGPIAAGESLLVTHSPTLSEGEYTLAVELDPDDLVTEASETNNTAATTFFVADDRRPDFRIDAAELTVTPTGPTVGETVTVDATVSNVGGLEETATVELYEGDPETGGLLTSQTVTIAAGGSTVVSATFTVATESVLVTAMADPTDAVEELSETNNTARRYLRDLPDLAIGHDNVAIVPSSPLAGDALTVSVTVRNAGTLEATDVPVALFAGDPATSPVATGRIASIPPGGNRTVDLSWTAEGGLTDLVAFADPDGTILERSEANNRTTRRITVPRATGPNLAPGAVDLSGLAHSAADLSINGTVVVDVENSGDTGTAEAFVVRLFEDRDGDGRQGAAEPEVVSTTVSDPVAAGGTLPLTLSVDTSLAFHRSLVWVAVDATDVVSEQREDDNRVPLFASCQAPPATPSLSPVEEWSLPGVEVETAPIVVQLSDDTGDGLIDSRDTPDVVFHTEDADGRAVYAVSGLDGSMLWTVRSTADNPLAGRLAHLAAADLDGDGIAEVVAVRRDSRLVALDHTGEVLWVSDQIESTGGQWAGGPAIGDLSGDGVPEIAVGRAVLDNTGSLVAIGTADKARNHNFYGPWGVPFLFDQQLSIIADVDLDGRNELVAGDTVYRLEAGSLTVVWNHEEPDNMMVDGFPAVGNLDGDPEAEIVYASSNRILILDHDGTPWGRSRQINPFFSLSDATFWNGAPSIADLDGDGSPEILVGSDNHLVAFTNTLGVKWKHPVDERSAMTGATAFDLDGDGTLEVLYQDHARFVILDGATGDVIHSRPNLSKTATEYPVVADVDGDGRAEILVPSNRFFDGDASTQGLHVVGHPSWQPTRSIHNQHGYHVTNVMLDGTVPSPETPSWQLTNTFRANQQLEPTPAHLSNLTVGLPRVAAATDEGVPVTVRVGNGGRAPVPSGVVVRLYEGDPTTGSIVGEAETPSSIGPGRWLDMVVHWTAPTSGSAAATAVVDATDAVSECDEADNRVDFELTETLLPDLEIAAGGVVAPSPVASGQLVPVSITVDNVGPAESPQTTVALHDGDPTFGDRIGEVELSSLALGSTQTVQIAWDSLGEVGTHTLHAVVDPEGLVAQESRDNDQGLTTVELLTATAPDLSVESITIDPETVTAGEEVSVEAGIVNRGAEVAEGFETALFVNRAETTRVATPGSLATGEELTVGFTLSTVGRSGTLLVETVADPSNTISEVSETNNRESSALVVNGSSVDVAVATDKTSYHGAETIGISIGASNSGTDSISGQLRVVIEDAEGAQVALVADEAITLRAGSSAFDHSWPADTLLPAPYAVVVTFERDGSLVARAATSFSIAAEVSIAADIVTDRVFYEPNQTVIMTGGVRNESSSTIVEDLTALVLVSDPTGTEVSSTEIQLAQLLPDAFEPVGDSWVLGVATPGDYRAELRVLNQYGDVLALDSSAFTVEDSAVTGGGLDGDLTLSPDRQGIGGPVAASYLLDNNGNADISDFVVHLEVLELASGEVVTTLDDPVSLPQGASTEGTWRIETGGLAPGQYVVSLSGVIGPEIVRIASKSLSLLPGLVVDDLSVREGDSGTKTVESSVRLLPRSSETVTVDFATVDGSAAAGEDYEATTGTLTFAPGETTKSIPITVLSDTVEELHETILVNLSNATGALIADGQGVVTLEDEEGCASKNLVVNPGAESESEDRLLPGWEILDGAWEIGFAEPLAFEGSSYFEIDAGNGGEVHQDVPLHSFEAAIDGGAQEFAFEAFVWSPAGAQITVEYRDQAGSILDTYQSGLLTNGESWTGVVDRTLAPTGSRTARIRLVSSGEARVAFDRVSLRSLGTLTLASQDLDVLESETVAGFGLSLSCASTGSVSVGYETVNLEAVGGEDYKLTSGTTTIASGTVDSTVEVPLLDDTLDEDDERFELRLTSEEAIVLDTPIATILDDDAPVTLSPAPAAVTEGDDGSVDAIFTLSLSAPSGKEVRVDYATVPTTATSGSDYAAINGTMVFSPGQTEQQVTVAVAGDTVDELVETFELAFSNPVNARLEETSVVGTIVDDDQARITVGDVELEEGDDGTGPLAQVPVVLSVPSDREITVSFTTVPGNAVSPEDFQANSGTITFPAGTTARTIPIQIIGDTIEEATETFTVELDNPTNAEIADPEATLTILDDDGPVLSIDDVELFEGNSGTTEAVFTITSMPASTRTVTVDVSTADGEAVAGEDYEALTTSLTFDPGETIKTVPVTVFGEKVEEPDERFFVGLEHPVNAAMAKAEGVGTILDDDVFYIEVDDAYLVESKPEVELAFQLNRASEDEIRVDWTTTQEIAVAGEDYLSASGTVIFPPGSVQQLVAITLLDDGKHEGPERFWVDLSGVVNAHLERERVGVHLLDDEKPASYQLGTTIRDFVPGHPDIYNCGSRPRVQPILATDGKPAYSHAGTGKENFYEWYHDVPGVNLSTGFDTTFNHDGTNFKYWKRYNFWPIDGELYGNEGSHNYRFTTELHAWFVYEPGTAIRFGSDDDGWCFVNHKKAVDLGWCHGPTSRLMDLDSMASDFGLVPGETYRLDCFQAERGRGASGFYFRTPLYLQQFDPGTLQLEPRKPAAVEGSELQLEVHRVGGRFGDVAAKVASEEGSATPDEDYVPIVSQVSFGHGDQAPKDVSTSILDDPIEEGDETFDVELVDPTPTVSFTPFARRTVTILDDESFPVPELRMLTLPEGSSGQRTRFVRIVLDGEHHGAVLDYSTQDGTATASEDYLAASGSLSFAPGETLKSLRLDIVGDETPEEDEWLEIVLTGSGIRGGSARLRLTLVDDDICPGPDLLVNGGNELPLVDGEIFGWTEVTNNRWTKRTRSPSPFEGSAYFFAGSGPLAELSQDVDVSGYADFIDDGEQWFAFHGFVRSYPQNPRDRSRIVLEFLDGAGSVLATVDTLEVGVSSYWHEVSQARLAPRGTRSIRIRLIAVRYAGGNNDGYFDGLELRALRAPALSVGDVSVTEGQSGSHTATVVASMSCAADRQVSVNSFTEDGSAGAGVDYEHRLEVHSFPIGTTSAEIDVEILGDTLVEGNETFHLRLSDSQNAAIARPTATITIVDDESMLSIGKAKAFEGNEGFTNLDFTVTLEPALELPVTVDYATEDYSTTADEDYVTTSGTLTFEPGETTKVVTVQVIGDTEVEDDETFFVTLTNPNNAGLAMAKGRGTIKQDDIFITASDAQVIEGNQGSVDLTFDVELSTPSSEVVTVDYATADDLAEAGVDYEARSGSLSFPAGNTLATVTVPVYGDTEAEGSETLQLRLSSPVNAYLLDPEESGTGFIVDDDDCGSPNLIRNAGAETPIYHVGVPEWRQVIGEDWSARHSNPSPFEGGSYFAPGNVAEAELRQDIDVSQFANTIDRGAHRFLFEGWVRSGNTSPPDTTRVIVEYRDADNTTVLGTYDSGQIASVDAWKNLADLRVTPTGTRRVRVRLLARRGRSSGYTYAFFDGLVLRSLGTPIFEIDDLDIQEADTESVVEELEVRLNCPAEETVTVDFATVDDTATAGSDYTPASGTLTYAPGETSQAIPLEVLGDYFNEGLETFQVELTDPSKAVLMDAQATVSIRDSDLATPPVEGQDFVYTLDEDFDLGFPVAVNHESPNHDQLQLDEKSSTFPYIWVAASRKGTIVKIDTRSGEVLGEYSTNPDNRGNSNPSRTTVGLDGTVWVGNRNDSSATHIGLPELGQCVDRNGNGVIETSSGYKDILPWRNPNGEDTKGGVSTATDECILHYVKLPYRCTTRHVSVDRDGNVWLGCWGYGRHNFALVDGESGEILRTTGSLGCGGYGGLVDSNGILWSAHHGSRVLRWDPSGVEPKRCIRARGAYGLALGPNGDVYVNDHGRNRIHQLAPQGNYLRNFERGSRCGQGLAVDTEGDVWSSSSRWCGGTKIGHTKGDGTFVGRLINIPKGTTGIAVDSNDKIWAAADQASQVIRIDPDAGPIGADGLTPIGNVDLIVDIPGARPYNYSDMTGSQLLRFTAPQGSWTVIQDAGSEGSEWGSLEWNTESEASTPEGTETIVEVRAADTLAGLGGTGWIDVDNGVPFETFGRFLQIRVTLEANADGVSPVFSDLRAGVTDATELTIGDVTVDETDGLAELPVTLSKPPTQDVVVDYTTADGDALAGSDYEASTGTVTIPAGKDSTTIAIPILDDNADEPDETFTVTITDATNASIADAEGVVTIVDDDPLPLVSVGDASVVEGDEGTTILSLPVTLSHPSFFPVAVDFETVDGTAVAGLDYHAFSGTLFFPVGVTSYPVEIEVIGDLLDEFDETLTLRVSGSVYGVLADSEGLGTILDDDLPPTVTIDDVSVPEGDAGSTPGTFTLALSAPSGRETSVAWTTVAGTAREGTDYESAGGTAVFPQGATTANLPVSVLGDLMDEPDETFTVVLSEPLHLEVEDEEGLGTILDDDEPPTMTVGDATVHEGDSGTVEAVLPVELSQPSGWPVSVDFETVDDTATATEDYLPRADTLLVPTETKTHGIRIEVRGDRIDELDETLFVELTNAAHAVLQTERAEITIVDDDEALMSIADVTVEEGDSGTTDAVFPVTLAVLSDREITVDYTTIADTATEMEDYEAVSGELVFEPLVDTEREVRVPVVGDLILEPLEETFAVELSNVTNTTFEDPTGLGTIFDDEVCLGPNLLANPGAEQRPVDGEIPGWVEVEGTEWAWERSGAVEPAEGVAYFSAGTPQYAELAQDIDVSAYADRIATGTQAFVFGGAVRTLEESTSDTARIVVEYRDETNSVVLDAFDTGDLASPLEWQRVEDVRAAPTGTAVIRVRLLATRWSETENDGYFDDLSLASLRAATVTVGDVTTYEGDTGTHDALFPVALACPFYQGVDLDYATSDGTAIAAEDYLAVTGSLSLPVGDSSAEIPVPIVGDEIRELHEDFRLGLSETSTTEAVLLDPEGLGVILDDDFCPRTQGFWKSHVDLWPTDYLVIGGVEYDVDGVMALLLYEDGDDMSHLLAKQLAATKLNLLVGSDPWIVPTVEEADEFLMAFPPGSDPRGEDRSLGESFKDAFDRYNKKDGDTCKENKVLPATQQSDGAGG